MDPEVPVLSVVELGIVRDIKVDADGAVTVSVTPTYSGCPAMQVIEQDILEALRAAGVERAEIRTVFTPAWTTDWLAEPARRKLEAYGIAPPMAKGEAEAETEKFVPLRRRAQAVECPYCHSTATRMRSEFGSTACKSIMSCDACHQPFELFKSI